MVKFVIVSDCLFYKTIVKTAIEKIFESSDCYSVLSVSTIEEMREIAVDSILIVEMNRCNGIVSLQEIRKSFPQVPLLVLGDREDCLKSTNFAKSLCFDFISKSNDISKQLENSILRILGEKKLEHYYYFETEVGKVVVPTEEITSFFYNHKQVVIHGYSKTNGRYTYQFRLKKNCFNIANLLKIQDKTIHVSLKNAHQLEMNENLLVSSYSDDLKQECCRLRKAGISTKTIHELKKVSVSSIYRWEKEEKMREKIQSLENNSKKLESQLSKYRKIEEIVREE